MPPLIPGSFVGMNHYFTLNNPRGSKVFLPIDSVLKDESIAPTASSAPAHPYSTRSPSYQYQNAIYHQSQSSSQLSNPQLYHPAAEIAHLPRAGVEENFQHHNLPSYSNVKGHGHLHQYEAIPGPVQPASNSQHQQHHSVKGHGPVQQKHHQYETVPGPVQPVSNSQQQQRHNVKGDSPVQQRQYQYETVPGPVQPFSYNQQQQYQNHGSNVNPYNLEVGSMILHGDSPACSGIIKWIGYLPRENTLSAGIEMVSKK